MIRNLVLFVNPPNSNLVISKDLTVANPMKHSDWADYPSMGILSLASAVEKMVPELECWYLDGMVCGYDFITDTIDGNCVRILAVCVSALSATYEAGLGIFRFCREVDPGITTVIGNDHFTALYPSIMRNHGDLIDCGFVGNEVVTGLGHLLNGLYNTGHCRLTIPGLVYAVETIGGYICNRGEFSESVWADIDYSLLNRVFNHTAAYDTVFAERMIDRLKEWTGRDFNRGVAVEFARGCVKFRNDNACTFCSIQYGGLWKNAVRSAEETWNVLYQAYWAGYDYIYVVTDELALTFRSLLTDMLKCKPYWAAHIGMTGYCRADGLAIEKNARLLKELGFEIMMVGLDAFTPKSLQAFNKTLRPHKGARDLYQANFTALETARKVGLQVRVGVVVGHIGITYDMLRKSVQLFEELVSGFSDVICTADVEVLSPEPGSMEWRYLTEPKVAQATADRLDLNIGLEATRGEVAAELLGLDVVRPTEMLERYVKALTPGVDLADLVQARVDMREIAVKSGIAVD